MDTAPAPGLLLPNGYRLARRLPGAAWLTTHRDLPGRSWLLLPDPLPTRGGGPPLSGHLAALASHPTVDTAVDRIAWGTGTAALHVLEGARLLAELPAPLPPGVLRVIARAASSLLDAAARAGVGLALPSPEHIVWRTREGTARFLLRPGADRTREPTEAAIAHLLLRWAPPHDLGTEVLRRVARRQAPLSAFVDVSEAAGFEPEGGSEVAALSSMGSVRAANEDAFGWARVHGGGVVYAVADGASGAGGSGFGERASRAAVDAVLEVARRGARSPAELLEAAFAEAWAAVQGLPPSSSTSLVAAVLRGRHLWLAHVGDARAWRVLPHAVEPLMRDHSLAERLLALGRITPAEVRTHPHRQVLLRTIGVGQQDEVEYAEAVLEPDERLLLTTAGLSAALPDDVIAAILRGAGDVRRAVTGLHEAALAAGAPDNLTLLLVEPGLE